MSLKKYERDSSTKFAPTLARILADLATTGAPAGGIDDLARAALADRAYPSSWLV
jgi:hypothetical protein